MKSNSSNRSFGLLFFIVFLGIALWPLTKGESLNIYLLFISLIFLILGYFVDSFIAFEQKSLLLYKKEKEKIKIKERVKNKTEK